MVLSLIEELLTGDSKEIRDIADNEAILVGFLTLVKGIDDLPDIDSRFYEDTRSLYQVTSSGHAIDELMRIMADFFGQPAKAPGKSLPVTLRFDPAVKYLGGIRKDQAFFQKKIKTGSYYGALWPWKKNADKIEIHLGFCSQSMSNADYGHLEALVKTFLSKKKLETVSDVGGQIHGISLPSFLQMSEMEGATYTLRVAGDDRVGYLYLDGGNLIAAQYGDCRGSEAAYRIISWDKASIRIEPADAEREREIHEPLMHVMMESLKIKDEDQAESAAIFQAAQKKPLSPDRPQPEKKPPVKKHGPPPAPTVAADTSADMQPIDSILLSDLSDNESEEKDADTSVDKKKPTSRVTKLLMVLGGVILLAGGVIGGGEFLEYRQTAQRYGRLMANLAAEKALDAQIILMMKYLKAYPEDAHRAELENRLRKANREIEAQAYEKTLADVKRLSIDGRYEKKALSLYTDFLTKYPQSPYVESVNAAIEGIHQKIATAHFERLAGIPENDFPARYRAYRTYLERFPRGAEKEAVNRMLSDLGDQYYRVLEEQAAICEAKTAWEDCLARCDRFLAEFAILPNVEKVRALRSRLQDKQDRVELTVKAELAGDDYIYAKRIYTDYLSRRPDTTQKTYILKRIEALNGELAKKSVWEQTLAYATNSDHDVNHRIQRVETYIQKNQTGPYTQKARDLLGTLEPEREAAMRIQKAEEQRRQALAREQAEKVRRERDARRIQQLRAQISEQIRDVASRYTDNGDGTVTDRVTGLTWCLLDSYLELGRCISYRTAKTYVGQLNVGNHADWRLPTAGELAGIYKSSPYFPASGANWYWTADSFVRGYHRVVDVVTAVPETVFTRISKNEENCGHVRAVRRSDDLGQR